MASNTTQRRAQAIMLASRVEAFRDWIMLVDCGHCGTRAVPMNRFPAEATVMSIIQRLRCHACRAPAARVSMDNLLEGHQRRVIRVWGPGSYG